MSKKSFAIFAIGAVAGWTVAQRVSGNGQAWPTDAWDAASSDPSLHAEQHPAPLVPATSRSESAGTDPFRGAFKAALAEVNSRSNDLAEPQAEVA
jgi:hypothetical protein